MRELRFVDEVPYRTLTPARFRDEVNEDVDRRWSDTGLRDYADTYGRLGFFDVNLDLRPIFTQSRITCAEAPARLSVAIVTSSDRRID